LYNVQLSGSGDASQKRFEERIAMGMIIRLTVITLALVFAASSEGAAVEEKKVNPSVIIETSMGNITVELYQDKAPKTVANFLEYVKTGYFKGTIFHRVIKGFMIQGGGLSADMKNKPTQSPIENEATNGLKNVRGTIAMARTAEIHSATSQFFINTVDNSFLDHRSKSPDKFGYCVFGKVTSGMDVVDKLEGVQTETKGMYQNVPTKPILITDARLKD
jgi:cyclophilin family peptidyl-prolyl cis-trans isomerase